MIEVAKYVMGLLYFIAGVLHFRKPKPYVRIIPPAFPAPLFLVYFTGAWEMIAAVLLLLPGTQVFAAWGIIILLVLVFPANVQMAGIYKRKKSPWYWAMLLRLPMQAVLIWWAWQYTLPDL